MAEDHDLASSAAALLHRPALVVLTGPPGCGRSTMLRCSSGGHNTLIFGLPPGKAGGPAVPASDASGCWTLMEAVMR